MKTKKYTKKELIGLLQEFAQRIGETPKKRLLNEDADMPSDMTFRVAFGSWGNALRVSGLEPVKIIPFGARKGKKNKKGVDRVKTNHGYIHLFKPEHPLAMKNGYVREHRMVAYDAGLLTDPSYEVHHVNGNKADNRIENLEVMPKPKHSSITWKGKKRAPWTDERRRAVSERMKGNKNWKGNIYQNPELIK